MSNDQVENIVDRIRKGYDYRSGSAAAPFQPPIILNDHSCRAEGDGVLAGRDGEKGESAL